VGSGASVGAESHKLVPGYLHTWDSEVQMAHLPDGNLIGNSTINLKSAAQRVADDGDAV